PIAVSARRSNDASSAGSSVAPPPRPTPPEGCPPVALSYEQEARTHNARRGGTHGSHSRLVGADPVVAGLHGPGGVDPVDDAQTGLRLAAARALGRHRRRARARRRRADHPLLLIPESNDMTPHSLTRSSTFSLGLLAIAALLGGCTRIETGEVGLRVGI